MPEVTKNSALQRYEIHENGQLLGFAAYRDLPDGVVELPPPWSNRLTKAAASAAR